MIVLLAIGLVGVAVLVSTFWTVFIGAYWSPTPLPKVRRMLSLAQVKPEDVVYDLGCGDGRIIITATREYGSRSIGIEADPFHFLYTWVTIRISGLSKKKQGHLGKSFSQRFKSSERGYSLLVSERQ